MDRAYRFGQTRDVYVYRLLGAGSIEELIYARQVYKQQQMAIGYNASVQTRYFSGVSGDKNRQGELFGLKNIFALHEDTWSTKIAVRHPWFSVIVKYVIDRSSWQIESSNIVNFDWALAHMDGVKSKKTRRKSGTAEDWVYETELKEMGEDVGETSRSYPELKLISINAGRSQGSWCSPLGRQFVSWSIPRALAKDTNENLCLAVPEEREDSVARILEGRWIKYSHRNDDILVPNSIEEQQMKKAKKVRDMRWY